MPGYINKKTLLDADTGEILKEKSWVGYDGFTDKGYMYRAKCCHIKYYFDSMPCTLSIDAFNLLMCIAELMNNENVLVYRVKRKSKFSSIIYKPYDKDDVRENIRYKMGINKFDRCWGELNKHILKRIDYNGKITWAVNPSVVSKCRYVPYWLYEAFHDTMDPHLSALAIKKLNQKVAEYYDESNKEEFII